MSFSENLGSFRKGCSFGFVRVRRANQTKTDVWKSSVYYTFRRKERSVRSNACSSSRFASKLPSVPEVSFFSWRIWSSRSCKPDSEFGGHLANPLFSFWLETFLLTAGSCSCYGSRSYRTCVRLLKKFEAVACVQSLQCERMICMARRILASMSSSGYWCLTSLNIAEMISDNMSSFRSDFPFIPVAEPTRVPAGPRSADWRL